MTERIILRVSKGMVNCKNVRCLIAADYLSEKRLNARGYSVGDILSAEMRKPRNVRFHRMAHALGKLLAENLVEFEDLDGHQVLKRIQVEADIECEHAAIILDGKKPMIWRFPRSLSFDSMSEERFAKFYAQVCKYICARYWPELDQKKIEEMAEMMEAI